MIISILQVILIFVIPFLIIKFNKFIITKWFGSIGSAYFLGIVVALIIFAFNQFGVNFKLDSETGQIVSHVSISVAIPLLLFSANLKEAKKLSKSVLTSFASLVFSTMVVATIVFYIYGKSVANGGEVSAMAIGMYTGGTPNFNAIANIFGLDSTILAVANLSDMIIGAVFYMFLLTAAKPLLSKVLKSSSTNSYLKEDSNIENTENIDISKFKFSKKLFSRFILAFIIAAISAGIGILVWIIMGATQGRMNDFLVPSMMIGVTVLGIAFSFNKKIRETKNMNVLGQYFILVFSFALASSIDMMEIKGLFGPILIILGTVTLGVFVIHTFISKLLKIDVDCAIVTLTAGVYGPAFIPAITKQIKNDNLTVPGLITGSIGYAIGTFLGWLLGMLFLI